MTKVLNFRYESLVATTVRPRFCSPKSSLGVEGHLADSLLAGVNRLLGVFGYGTTALRMDREDADRCVSDVRIDETQLDLAVGGLDAADFRRRLLELQDAGSLSTERRCEAQCKHKHECTEQQVVTHGW